VAARPSGYRWDSYAAGLRLRWWQSARRCYYCDHPFAGAAAIEVCHLISPEKRPDLAWSRVVPGHGSTYRKMDKRCPECDLACNWLAHNSPGMKRDDNGFDLPFSAQFMDRAVADRARFLAKSGNSGKFPAILVHSPAIPRNVGRVW
jgi:hypothetical protein